MTDLIRRIRPVSGIVEPTWEAIHAALRPIAQTYDGAVEVASAFYDVAWVDTRLFITTYGHAMDHLDVHRSGVFATSWRGACDLAAELHGHGDYTDFIWDAVAEQISDRVRDLLAAIGLRPVI